MILSTGTVYDFSTQLCCDGVVRPMTYGNDSTCCGTEVVNNTAAGFYWTCCGSTPINYTLSCCYDTTGLQATPYDENTQICCNGTVQVDVDDGYSFQFGSDLKKAFAIQIGNTCLHFEHLL
jgi:hypothetical protein